MSVLGNPPRYCNGCNFILLENEHRRDSEGKEYCDNCAGKIEAIAGDYPDEER